jgi:DNA-binding IclR family transcriptional regulator
MDYTVEAVDRAVGLLFLVAQHPGLGVTELAKRSGNTKGRAFRLLDTLEQRGLVQREGDAATYSLGYKALFLGAAAQDQISLPRLAKPHMQEIGEQCNETVLLRILDGLESVCIARWDSSHAVRIHTEIGNRRPLYVGASSKLLLAFAPAELREAVLAADREKFTPNTITSRSKLEAELSRIKLQGYSVSISERTDDTVAVAAPVRGANREVVAALSITGPSPRLSKDNLESLIALVQSGAQRLSLDLGYVEQRPAVRRQM